MIDQEIHDRYAPEDVLGLYREHSGTLTDLVASRAETDPDRIMLIDSERSWTWAAAMADAARLAGHLRDSGVVRGDRVAVIAPNSGWHVLGLLAAARLGAILVPVNPGFRDAELAYVLRLANPRVVLTASDLVQAIGAVLPEQGASIEVKPFGPALLSAEPVTTDAGEPGAGTVIIFTSGTTGFPKGALHSQRTVLLAGESFVGRVHLQPHDRVLTILPLFHVNAMFYSVAGALAAGATLILQPHFSASRFWPTVVRYGATQVNMIEAVGAILIKRPEEEYESTHTLRKIYGIRQALAERFRERFGVPHLVGGYGMTEIPGILATPYDEQTRPGSMGRLGSHPGGELGWAQCRIVDDAGDDLPDGAVGELLVRTPTVMLGYFDDPEQTAQAFDGEWFRTGDLVRRDDDGWYYFVARKKDIIRVRGENVSGAELDRVVAAYPDVVLAAAVGVPTELGDEDILLAVTVRAGATVTADDVVEHCRHHLADVKLPRYVLFTQHLPVTPTGKVAKHLLRADPTLRDLAIDTRQPVKVADGSTGEEPMETKESPDA